MSETSAPNPTPFLLALGAFLVIAVLAFVFLRSDDDGELLWPDRLTAVDDDTIRVVAEDHEPCQQVLRAQVDLADDDVFVELVVTDSEEPCTESVSVLEAEITLPEPIDDRELRAGAGRLEIPCGEPASTVTCAADR